MTRLSSWYSAVFAALLVSVLAVTKPAARTPTANPTPSRSEEGRCSDRTLRGSYAFAIEGTIVDGPAPLPIRGVALTRFDGRGTLTQVDHLVVSGFLPPQDWTPATGTYHLNRDCTGVMEIDIPGSPFSPVTLRLSVGANGAHINTVVSKPGFVVSSTGTKVDLSGDDR